MVVQSPEQEQLLRAPGPRGAQIRIQPLMSTTILSYNHHHFFELSLTSINSLYLNGTITLENTTFTTSP